MLRYLRYICRWLCWLYILSWFEVSLSHTVVDLFNFVYIIVFSWFLFSIFVFIFLFDIVHKGFMVIFKMIQLFIEHLTKLFLSLIYFSKLTNSFSRTRLKRFSFHHYFIISTVSLCLSGCPVWIASEIHWLINRSKIWVILNQDLIHI